ncbi:1-phosphofructokinase family hexose kinase [Corynebacterium pacaense]|uniref:1-phosphofructokinase family hexose kinase n=1 Tax=Corynebacterium pacaense TaxID=1816684 RepID=UPI0009BC5AED|nr:1-phosphofructokinase family hexose kinase [Corynebacterium pacaense]
MIVTLTPNPSIDSTLELDAPLSRGAVQRLVSATSVAGGKGINVAHAIALAGLDTLAVFPSGARDPFLSLVDDIGLPLSTVTISANVRTNTTITEPDGTTTKLNGPGPRLEGEKLTELEETLIDALGADVDWVVLSGSLPPGVPTAWYSHLTALIREHRPGVSIAVDTSDAPLQELGRGLSQPGAAPTLIKPNGLELGQLVGLDGQELEERAAAGDYAPIVTAASTLVERGIAMVLVTLGSAGAVLVTGEGAWVSSSPRIEPVSTVGAGDSSLAGFVMAQSRGLDTPTSLIQAVSYGSAAAALPGTTIPNPDQVTTVGAEVIQVV